MILDGSIDFTVSPKVPLIIRMTFILVVSLWLKLTCVLDWCTPIHHPSKRFKLAVCDIDNLI
jgi:hypothetical protein